MIDKIFFLLRVCLMTVPFILLALLNGKANLKKSIRHRQCFMPFAALIFCIAAALLLVKINALLVFVMTQLPLWIQQLALWVGTLFDGLLTDLSDLLLRLSAALKNLLKDLNLAFWAEILSNALIILGYVLFKTFIARFLLLFTREGNRVFEFFASSAYYKNELKNRWYVKPHFKQGITLMKTLYIVSFIFAVIGIGVTAFLYDYEIIASLYYPVFSVILVGEIYFFLDGEFPKVEKNTITGEKDETEMVADYSLMRKFLRRLFGDKLLSENTTNNNALLSPRTNDEVLSDLEEDDGVAVEAYGKFMRKKMARGLEIDQSYLMSGLDLLKGKSILFNNPFYYDLIPYIFYPMNRAILRHKKVLIILGRHAIEEGVEAWCRKGLSSVNHIPTLWNIGVLDGQEQNLDVGIITRSSVHDLKLHEANESFFAEVDFVMLIEPSKLVATAQIGLNSIVRYCRRGGNRPVFCSTDKNCDGIVDALSHILMTSIEEVSATNKPGGASSYMCWDADNENLQHRLLPNISRYLGVGTELSFAALKNQIPQTTWYGGESFPVTDMHWIVKQYHHDLLSYASLPTHQAYLDEVFRTSANMWDATVEKHKYMTVEDESFNMFEVKREFSTRAKQQGFINVISSDYLLKGYMADNDTIFNTDSKAIPYIVADYADTERNLIYRICLRLSSCHVSEDELHRELSVIHMDSEDIPDALWRGICKCSADAAASFSGEAIKDTLTVRHGGKEYEFTKDIIKSKRAYSYKTGCMETLYSITDPCFINAFLGDLCSAEYIAEDENGTNQYLGTELRGHVFQKHLPGQFFTFGGKYYEMLRLSSDGKVVVRRAADHITGRPQYRQVRNYTLHAAFDSTMMGHVRDIGGIKVTRQYADISVETPAYWNMLRYNDFETAKCITINGVPKREYLNKHILKIDFETMDVPKDVLNTIVLLMNEVFRTLYADNQGMIAAVNSCTAEAPYTYSLTGENVSDSSIYIIEDSQLDIGLLVSVERNLHRIFAIICDYLNWHFDTLEKSEGTGADPDPTPAPTGGTGTGTGDPAAAEKPKKERKGLMKIIGAICDFFKKLFKRKKKKPAEPVAVPADPADTPAEPIDPTDTPAEPTDPADTPAEPTDPTDTPAEPTDPTDTPAEPTDPTDTPAEPTDPADIPAEPTDPADTPAEPVATPADPTDTPAEPAPEAEKPKKKGGFFSNLFKRKEKKTEPAPEADSTDTDTDPDDGDNTQNNASMMLFSADDSIEFEGDGATKVSAISDHTRKPYHESYYLLYGGKTLPESVRTRETLDFLLKLGYGNNFLEQARLGKNEAERIEQSFDPNRAGARFCDFCGAELTGTEYEVLADGRERCIACGRTAIKSEAEFRELYETVARNMRTFYGVLINDPINIKMVNSKKLHRRLGKTFVPTGKADGRVLGVAIKDKDGYSILIENGSPRIKATMTMVHELTHIWQYVNWDAKAIKKMYGKADNLLIYEGMSKWSEIQYAYLIGEAVIGKREEIITRMRQDEYGFGFIKYADKYPLSTTTTLKGPTPFDTPEKPR